MTFSITTLIIMTLNMSIKLECSDLCYLDFFTVVLTVIVLSVVIESIVMPSVNIQSVVVLIVVAKSSLSMQGILTGGKAMYS
jgi:hypothetical protein